VVGASGGTITEKLVELTSVAKEATRVDFTVNDCTINGNIVDKSGEINEIATEIKSPMLGLEWWLRRL